MITNFSSFKVKVEPKPFITQKGKSFSHTAGISFFNDANKEIGFREYAFMDPETLNNLIINGEPLLLDDCYLEDFSFANYRDSSQTQTEDRLEIKDFSARNAVFNTKKETDFSFVNFSGIIFSLEKALFLNGTCTFHKVKFTCDDINFIETRFVNGTVNFTNASFNAKRVQFNNVVFGNGIKDFQYVKFNCSNLSFESADFGNGDVNFLNVQFDAGNIWFKEAKFGDGKVDFHYSTFGKGNLNFERTDFGNGRVDFRKVEFNSGKVNFNRAVFGDGDVSFEETELSNSKMTCKKTNFGNGNLLFEMAEFSTSDLLLDQAIFGGGNVSFQQSSFHKLSVISCHLNHHIDFRVLACDYLDLSDTIVRDILDFTPYEHKVQITLLKMNGMRLLGQIHIDWHENKLRELIANQKDTNLFEKAEQFRTLKENFGRIGHYSFEDLAYIEFKRYEQRSIFKSALEKSRISALWQYPLFGFKTVIFDKMGLYATSPMRVFTSLLLVYLFFSLLHLISPLFFNTSISCIDADSSISYRMVTTFYYSLITFTTVGYGDCYPVGFLRIVAAIEGFLGPFMMSYFTVAFARKILR